MKQEPTQNNAKQWGKDGAKSSMQEAYDEGFADGLEEAAKFVEENYEEPFTNIVGNPSWRERGPRKLAAAIRALKDHSPQQDSN